jgi:hypothetical protein
VLLPLFWPKPFLLALWTSSKIIGAASSWPWVRGEALSAGPAMSAPAVRKCEPYLAGRRRVFESARCKAGVDILTISRRLGHGKGVRHARRLRTPDGRRRRRQGDRRVTEIVTGGKRAAEATLLCSFVALKCPFSAKNAARGKLRNRAHKPERRRSRQTGASQPEPPD